MNFDFITSNPVWQSGPFICTETNLPAFATAKEAKTFDESNGTGCKTSAPHLCATCKGYHFESIAPDPAGGSSGTGRSSYYKRDKKLHTERLLEQAAKPKNKK